MAFDLIIFDMDGTLVDSEPIANRVFYEKLLGHGLDSRIDEAALAHDLTGLSLPSCFALLHERYGLVLPAGFEHDLQAETYRRLRQELQPIPGVPDILPRLPQAKCVASSSEPDKIVMSLQLCGIDRHFGPHLYSARQVARGKPHPDLFLHAAGSMGHRPPACAVVEDSLPGVQAGLRAGMTVFAYRPEPADPHAAAFADLGCRVFTSMAQLPGLLAAG
ncbi:HAD family hydrolase [Ferrovibrio sp.]|uniref:HAD family hydrolase n=1 Tax=Ferrovibrio sp. TaxID=1917215 RepID=UPI00311E98B4